MDFMRWCRLSLVAMGGCAASLIGAQDSAFTYQGRLLNDGLPAQGSYDFEFRLYGEPSGGEPLGEPVSVEGVAVVEGIFTVSLDFGTNLLNPAARWLELGTRTNDPAAVLEVLSPRQPITSSPVAVQASVAAVAGRAETVQDGAIGSAAVAPGSLLATNFAADQVVRSVNGFRDDVTLEGGGLTLISATPSGLAISSSGWSLGGNAGTEPGRDFLGTTDESPLELRANGIGVMRWVGLTNGGLVNLIAGYAGNTVASNVAGVTIGGGGGRYSAASDWAHEVASDYATVAGGMGHRIGVSSASTTISGGFSNRVANSSEEAVIAGGSFNVVEENAFRGVIGGGFENLLGPWAYFSKIASGYSNQVHSQISTISGGNQNAVETQASVSTIGGGGNNRVVAGAFTSTIGGGADNLVGPGSFTGTIAGGGTNRIGTNSWRSTIGGGKANRIESRSPHSTIGGGVGNVVGDDALGAVIPGGISNRVDGAFGMAAGQQALAVHDGALVWADAAPWPFVSEATNEVALRATGGMRVVTAVDEAGQPLTGVALPTGSGSWETLSDRESKADYEPVEPRKILEAVAALPLSTWRYRGEEASVRHLGPVAQDFRSAFELGSGAQTIATVDADGVALAAIQGLYQVVRQQQAEIAELRARLEALGSVPQH